jgi:formate hydrogenlyase subunit 3/multisubunit Na+/H+ antiporter MnhD subunit
VSAALLAATVLLPLAMLAASLSPRLRARMPGWLWIAPLPGLGAATLSGDDASLWLGRFGLALDPQGALLLGVVAGLWIAAGVYARSYLAGDDRAPRFAEWWLATLAGSLGVFVAADLFSFYAVFALASLPAWGLIAHDDTPRARHAAAVTLGLAVVGEIALLLAFALLAAAEPSDSLAIRDVLAALPAAPARHLTLGLLVAGFGLKAGLVPLHVWLPLAHPAAPMPASAVLSGAIVKAGLIGWIRFLPFDPALAGWGVALAAIGLGTAFYAVAVGITQRHPKTILAYSTASQMGGVAAILGMGLAAGDASAVWAASFAAAHHVLVKGALFLAIGVAPVTAVRRRWTVLAPALLLSLALGGLPLTGGALAKLASKTVMGDGLGAALGTLSAAGTTLLMLHFFGQLRRITGTEPGAPAPAGLVAPWLVLAAAALAVPWALAPTAVGVGIADGLAPAALREAAWPIALGAALALALARHAEALPRLPEGDLVVAGAPAARAARRAGDGLERLEARLRAWPAAGLALLALAVLLGAVLARS